MENGRAVIAVVHCNDKVLLGKKRSDIEHFFAGRWHVPSETVEEGESDEDALIRGIMEEAGIKVKVGKFIGSHLSPTNKNVFWYECFADSDDVCAGSDLEDAKWVPKEKVMEICGERVQSFWSEEVVNYFSE
jgi:NADH pyrophosphatase NudC (nudix superfamily)